MLYLMLKKYIYKNLVWKERFIRELASSNFQLKAMGKRIAMNAPIQGTASDIMKIAMIKVRVALNNFDNANLLLQIHDEIVVKLRKKTLIKFHQLFLKICKMQLNSMFLCTLTQR